MAAPTLVPIVGVSQRCGTHWLFDLVTLHPACRPALREQTTTGADFEDLLLESAGLLADYAARTRGRWDRSFASDSREDQLLTGIGRGIVDFVVGLDPEPAEATHVVTKSPSADGLSLLPRLWPDAKPILLVRDGADVVASALASFGGNAERWMRVWRAGARSILDLSRRHPDNVLVIRYEDMAADLPAELLRVASHLGIDPEAFDLDAATSLPHRGSADTAVASGELHWRPTTAAGSSIGRGSSLTREQRSRLGWLAGAELRDLGYDTPHPGDPAGHRARDAAWAIARLGRRVLRR